MIIYDLIFILILVFVDPSPATSTYRKKNASFYGLEARGDHYAKRVMQWCRGWVRTTRVASLSKRSNSRKA
jgi:hypothetical protein